MENNQSQNISLLDKSLYITNFLKSKSSRFIIRKGENIYKLENCTAGVVTNHSMGVEQIGGCPDKEKQCGFGGIDIDCSDLSQEEKFELAKTFVKEFEKQELTVFIEQSKSKGFHIWLLFKGYFNRTFIQNILKNAIHAVTDKKIANGIIEIFPKGNGGSSILFFGFGAINSDGETFTEQYLAERKTAILTKDGTVDLNCYDNIGRSIEYNTKVLQLLEWLNQYPECFKHMYFNWGKGTRQTYALAIAGICKKLEYTLDDAIEIVTRFASDNNDEEIQTRISAVKSTYQKDNPAGCSIPQGKCESIPSEELCFEKCSFVKKMISETSIDYASYLKNSDDLNKIPPLKYVVNNLFPRKFVGIIFSEPNYGKTWLLLDLAISISNGTPVWENYFTEQQRALLFEGDAPNQLIRERLSALKNKANTEYLKFVNRYDLEQDGLPLNISSENGQKVFENFVKEFLPDIVIIDTFISFFDGDESRIKDVKIGVDFLRKLAFNYNCSILVSHHSRKRSAGERRKKLDMSDLIGSSGLSRLSSSIYSIIPSEEEVEGKTAGVVTNIKNWSKKTKTFKFELVKTEDNYLKIEYSTENVTVAPKNKQERIESYILETIAVSPEAEIRKEEIANDFEVSVNTAGSVIRKLVDKKILKKVGTTKAVYYIASGKTSCQNNTEIANNNIFGTNNDVDKKIVSIDRKFISINNPTIDISALKPPVDGDSNLLN